jgi:hypothetical protein
MAGIATCGIWLEAAINIYLKVSGEFMLIDNFTTALGSAIIEGGIHASAVFFDAGMAGITVN